MYRIGEAEAKAVADVIESNRIFRYGVDGGTCARFEDRWAEHLGVDHCIMTASGTNAIVAALVALGIGPGDEVLVPAYTYMATAIAVVSVGAIPVIIDIDESATISPEAIEAQCGPHTRAVIPVHMWGLACDMDAIMAVARAKKLYVVEDACQGVGGAYKGKALGSIGDLGAFSFNYFKNMTCGEGGAVVTGNADWADRVKCAVDPCRFYWNGRDNQAQSSFVWNGARASEFEGAILNVQLDRLDEMIAAMRKQQQELMTAAVSGSANLALCHSPEWNCATHTVFKLSDETTADRFAELTGGFVLLKTGRHVYTEWDQILNHRVAFHPLMDPFTMDANADCRKDYSVDMCADSLTILGRLVAVPNHPDRSPAEQESLIRKIQGFTC